MAGGQTQPETLSDWTLGFRVVLKPLGLYRCCGVCKHGSRVSLTFLSKTELASILLK